jgi:hypothetical protein
MGAEDDAASSLRQARPSKKKQSRRTLFRR